MVASVNALLSKTIVGTALLMLQFVAETAARAEHYLSIGEARQICFPDGERFESRTILLSSNQAKTIEQKSGVKVRSPTNQVWLAWQGTNLAGVLVVDHVPGKHEVIDFAVAIAPDSRVRQVEILEYREHYGGGIRDAKWRGQFKGKSSASKLKLNDDVYNISGATISCRNVTEGVKRVLATFELVVRPELVAAGRLPDNSAAPKP